jgi:hypothetical protein
LQRRALDAALLGNGDAREGDNGQSEQNFLDHTVLLVARD